jgi:hypothetical protein
MIADKDIRALADGLKNLEPLEGERSWTAEEVFDAVHGKLPRERLEELVDAAVSDPELADAFRIAREMPVTSDPMLDARSRPTRTRSTGWRRAAIAAAASVVVIAGVWFGVQPLDPSPFTATHRAESSYEIRSEVEAEKGLPRDRFELKWTDGPDGTRYFVEALDMELNVLFSKRHLEKARVKIPPAALEGLETGNEVIWRVEAYLDDGRTVRSPTFRTRVVD